MSGTDPMSLFSDHKESFTVAASDLEAKLPSASAGTIMGASSDTAETIM